MNDFESLSVRQLDRFVDGELTETERREILSTLDREPDGWRRLALAFVESQVLRSELRRYCGPEPLPVSKPSVVQTPRQLGWQAVAALLLVSLFTFGLGRWSNSGSALTARTDQRLNPHPQTYQPKASDGESDALLASDSDSPAIEEQRTMRLELEDRAAGQVQVVDVPVVDQASVTPEDLLKAPPMISDAVQRALLLSGRRVREERKLYEVSLDDGRSGIVPISDVVVERAGWDVYQ